MFCIHFIILFCHYNVLRLQKQVISASQLSLKDAGEQRGIKQSVGPAPAKLEDFLGLLGTLGNENRRRK